LLITPVHETRPSPVERPRRAITCDAASDALDTSLRSSPFTTASRVGGTTRDSGVLDCSTPAIEHDHIDLSQLDADDEASGGEPATKTKMTDLPISISAIKSNGGK
jgi:hypothetical protein